MPVPTLSQLLTTLKDKFKEVETDEQKQCYTSLLCHIASLFRQNLTLPPNYTAINVDKFLNDLPNHYQGISQDETIDKLISYYTEGKCPLLLGNIKWTRKSDRQKAKEEKLKREKEVIDQIGNIVRR